MPEYFQLSFLQTDDVSMLDAKVDKNFKRLENVRKGTYAKINELVKKNDELEKRLSLIERNICEPNIQDSGSKRDREGFGRLDHGFVLVGA